MLVKRFFSKKLVRLSLRSALVLSSPFVILLPYRHFGNASLSAAEGGAPSVRHAVYHEEQMRLSLIEYARQFQGLPYIWGSKKPVKGFDCSGFTQYVWNSYRAGLPEGAAGQYDSTANFKALDQAKAGDLVFFREGPRKPVSHVALVVQADSTQLRVLHSVTSRGVIEEDLLQSAYWKPKIDAVREVRPMP
jgi:cell wall-associated NlpC family hydrolase